MAQLWRSYQNCANFSIFYGAVYIFIDSSERLFILIITTILSIALMSPHQPLGFLLTRPYYQEIRADTGNCTNSPSNGFKRTLSQATGLILQHIFAPVPDLTAQLYVNWPNTLGPPPFKRRVAYLPMVTKLSLHHK